MEDLIQEIRELKRLTLLASKPMLTLSEAAQYTGMSVSALRCHLDEIGYSKPSKCIYLDKHSIDAWMRSNPVPSNSDIARQAAIYCDNH